MASTVGASFWSLAAVGAALTQSPALAVRQVRAGAHHHMAGWPPTPDDLPPVAACSMAPTALGTVNQDVHLEGWNRGALAARATSLCLLNGLFANRVPIKLGPDPFQPRRWSQNLRDGY